ncbi:MAG: hypothetical protein LGB72_05725 [Sulfurovum sp.]|nr:hypothetical protein [Sulfurovum sp.]
MTTIAVTDRIGIVFCDNVNKPMMRENEISKEKILSLLHENISDRSKKLMKIVECNGSQKIATLLQTYTTR